MKEWLKNNWQLLVGFITGVCLTVILILVFTKKSSDYSEAQNKIDDLQKQRDSISVIIGTYSNELVSKDSIIDTRQAETDSIYSLLVEANNKLIYVYQKQRNDVKVDTFGSAALLDYFRKLPE